MLITYLTEPKITLAFLLALSVITGALIETLKWRLIHWVDRQAWRARMIPLQRKLMQNFGYSEAQTEEEATVVDAYCFVVAICGHHLLMSALLLPVVLWGWDSCGPRGHLMFYAGALGDLAYSIYDSLQIALRTFCPEKFKCLGVQMPLKFFIIMVCMHHMLSIFLTVPMILFYPSLRALHVIMCSLLLAGGSCYLLGCYKFTLDTRSVGDFLRYKGIVLLQLAIIGCTRGYVWIGETLAVLKLFYDRGNVPFLYGGLFGGILMSCFNLLMLLDAVQAALKWLPKPRPRPAKVAKADEISNESPIYLLKRQDKELLHRGKVAVGAEVVLLTN